MQEIDEEQLEKQVAEAQDADLLKELMGQAIRLERDDLVEIILERSIRLNRLVEKLQDYELQPISISFLSEDEEDAEEAGPTLLTQEEAVELAKEAEAG